MKKSSSLLTLVLLLSSVVAVPSLTLAQRLSSVDPWPSSAWRPFSRGIPPTANAEDDDAALDARKLHAMALAIMSYAQQEHDPSATDALRTRANSAIIHPATIQQLARFAHTEPFSKGRLFSAIFTILEQHLQYVGSTAGDAIDEIPLLAGPVLPALLALHDVVTQGRNTFATMDRQGDLDEDPRGAQGGGFEGDLGDVTREDGGHAQRPSVAAPARVSREEIAFLPQLDMMILNLAFYLEDVAKQRGHTAAAFAERASSKAALSDHPFHDPRVVWILKQHEHDRGVKSMWAASTSQAQMRNRQDYIEKSAAKGDRLGMLAAANFYFTQAANSDQDQQQHVYEKACRYLEEALQDVRLKVYLSKVAVTEIGKTNTISEHITKGLDELVAHQNREIQLSQLGKSNFYWHQLVASDLGRVIASLRQVILVNFLQHYTSVLRDLNSKNKRADGIAKAYDDNLSQRFEPEIQNMAQQPPRLQRLWSEFTNVRDAASAAAPARAAEFDPTAAYRTKGNRP